MNPPVHAVRRALLDFFDAEARSLPWREDSDPYRILVSEVMLQQTRVETVKRYYGRWLEQFPTMETLAAAEEDDVLKAWEGLGYYRRARNLQATARAVRERFDGILPERASELRGLPGLGEYTSGAVASIAFGEVVPAVDGNVRRVLSRLYDEAAPTPRWLRDRAAPLVDPERPGDFNQALMELGATVCSPREPSCERCPLRGWCRAHAVGTVDERPGRGSSPTVRPVTFAVGLFHRDGEVLVGKRVAGGLLGGMWAFPDAELVADGNGLEYEAAIGQLAESIGLRALGEMVALAPVRHRFTPPRRGLPPDDRRGRTPRRRGAALGLRVRLALPRGRRGAPTTGGATQDPRAVA